MQLPETQTRKFVSVVFRDLPKQDYAKARKIMQEINVSEYTYINCNDITLFINYVNMCAEYFTKTVVIKLIKEKEVVIYCERAGRRKQ